MAMHNHHADHVNQGVFGVGRGGTGLDTVPEGHIVVGGTERSRLTTQSLASVTAGVEADVTALEAADVALDARLDALEGPVTSTSVTITLSGTNTNITVYKVTLGSISLAFLDGQANGTIPAANTVIGNIPAGYRPFGTAKFAAGGSASTNNFMRSIGITSGGDIVFGGDIVAGGTNIFFRAVPPWLVGG